MSSSDGAFGHGIPRSLFPSVWSWYSRRMAKEISRFGVGPRILVTAGTYAVLAGAATRAWPGICEIRVVPHQVTLVAVFC